ncbi:MAG: 5-formyltetrahydrofolate cyclo-ligase [Atopobiaceae bacterium]|jgi:5-formyltetrahydrofolate cyclo-ligase
MASSYGSDASKSALRNGYVALGRSLSPQMCARIDARVCSMFALLPEYVQCSLLLCYIPFHEEVDPFALARRARAAGKRVAFPLMEKQGSKLTFYEVGNLDDLSKGARGLYETSQSHAACLGDKIMPGELATSVCLVPGLVFDAEGFRVGFGAGYYDEFLASYLGFKVGLARSYQVSSNPLPAHEHDVCVDALVTEGSIWRCRTPEKYRQERSES